MFNDQASPLVFSI